MATQGPLYPGTVTTETGPSGDNDWLNASNIGADDGSEAQITAATYDAGDHSFRLKAQNFGFTIPSGSTIDGIVVEIDRRCFAGAAQDQEVRLYDDSGTLVGTDKQTATAWPASLTIATYGSSSDTWAASPTVTMVNDPDFGAALIALADGANTDIGVDFIRITIHYTPPPVTPVALAVTSTFTPAMTDVLRFDRTLAVSSTFAVALAKKVRKFLAVTSAFVPVVQKKVRKTLAVSSTFAPVLARSYHVTLEVLSTFGAALGTAYRKTQTLATSGTWLSGLVANFIAAGPPGLLKKIIRFGHTKRYSRYMRMDD